MNNKPTTVKNLLESKYTSLLKEVENIVDKNLLPELDDEFDWKQFIMYITLLFPDDDYEFHIEQLCLLKGFDINQTQIKQLVPIVEQYILWLKKFMCVYPNF